MSNGSPRRGSGETRAFPRRNPDLFKRELLLWYYRQLGDAGAEEARVC